MRRWLLVLALVLVAGGVAFGVLRRPAEWTAANAEALAELRAGIDALQKVYHADARAHLSKALELDPDCLAAKIFMLDLLDPHADGEARKRIIAELRAPRLERLNEREVFLVRYVLDLLDGKREEAESILDEYLAGNPDDAVALQFRANRAFAQGKYDVAQKEYERLLAVAPNYVVAYNQLGYSAMGQGLFGEAERMLRKYRYIAPDQANPHDSLGELFLLLGRYDEAKAEFDAALSVRKDFCASYQGLALLGQVSGRLDLAEDALARAEGEGGCAPAEVARWRDALARWRAATRKDWRGVVEGGPPGTTGEVGACPFVLTQRAFLALGENDQAAALEEELRKKATAGGKPGMTAAWAPCQLHLEGVRLLDEGRLVEAAERFARADEGVSYRGAQLGVFKLYNLVNLAAALRAAGSNEKADEIAEQVKSVNPKFAKELLEALALAN